MQFDWMSTTIGFLLGTVTGAAGIYFAEKFTDQRRRGELKGQCKKEFLEVKKQMPELIAELKSDLSHEENRLIREFFVVQNKKMLLGGSGKPRFIYYVEEHKRLRSKIDILENRGFLINVRIGNAPIYRMREEFVGLINTYG